MRDLVQKKLKAYLLYISMFSFFVLSGHLCFVYLYHDADTSALEWGTISEALIGDFPHFNPLIPSRNHNAYINKLLYRSILEYSPEKQSLEPSIMNCDTSNLLLIKCSMESSMFWSDGSEISPYDVQATLSLIKQTRSHPIIASLLDNTTMEVSSESLTFRNTARDINFLHVLLQPIIPQDVAENLNRANITGKFSEVWTIYSGRFRLVNIHQDETIGVTKLTLWRNEYYSPSDIFIDFYILHLFTNDNHFAKHTSSFNVFNDKQRLIANPIPRLRKFEYSLPQFTWVFFNTTNLSADERVTLAWLIDRDDVVKTLGESVVQEAYNPFLSDTSIDALWKVDVEVLKKWKPFYHKKELQEIALAVKNLKKVTISEEANAAPKITQAPLKFIQNSDILKYNFLTRDNILISWDVPAGTQKVFINDYELTKYSPGDSVFYYRLLEAYDSIVEGENIYRLYYEWVNGKEFQEEFYVYYYKDQEDKVREMQETFFSPEETNQDTTIEQIQELEENLLTLDMADSLLDGYLYEKDGSILWYKLVYSRDDPLMEKTALYLQDIFSSQSISLELEALSIDQITSRIRSNDLSYDILLLGINTGYFSSNIFPYFHSSQIENGYNLSNFKLLSLDILLEELKSHNIWVQKRNELEEKMLDIFQENQIMKILYTPKYTLLVDQNIQNFSFPGMIVDDALRYHFFLWTHLSEKKTIIWREKSLWWFFSYLISQLSF